MRVIVTNVEQNPDRGYEQVAVTVERETGSQDGHVELVVFNDDNDAGPWTVQLYRTTRGGRETLWTGTVDPYPAAGEQG